MHVSSSRVAKIMVVFEEQGPSALQSFECFLIFVEFWFIVVGFISCRLGRRELETAVVCLEQRWEERVVCVWGAVIVGMVGNDIGSWERRGNPSRDFS